MTEREESSASTRDEVIAPHPGRGRLLGAAILAGVAVAAGGIAWATTQGPAPGRPGRSHTSDQVVGWVDAPAPFSAPVPAPALTPYPVPDGPRCRAVHIRAAAGRGEAGLGSQLQPIVLTNIGRAPCVLAGYPELSGITHPGHRVRLAARRGTGFGGLVPARIMPGRHGLLLIETESTCPTLNRPGASAAARRLTVTTLWVGLPTGGTLDGAPVSLDTACGVWESQLGVEPAPPKQEPALPGSLASLRVRVVGLPATVRPGASISYVVVLINPMTVPVRLRPCPPYTEGVGPIPIHGARTFYLNCRTAGVIPAGGSVRFAMRETVRASVPAGAAKFFWDLAGGPAVGGVLEVR